MKKPLRWLLIIIALFVVVLVVGVMVALNAGVQTSVTLHFLQQKDPAAKLGGVSFGFGGGEIHGLEMNVGGRELKLGSATVQYSLSNLLFGHTKIIDSAIVKDVVFDASQPAKASITGAKGETASFAKSSPPSILIRKADLTGTALLPSQRSVQFSLNAQNVGSGSEGKATGTVIFQDKSADAKVTEMRTATQISVALDDSMMPKSADLLADLAATIPGQFQTSKLQAHLVAKALNSSSGDFTLTLTQPDTLAQLLSLKGTYGTEGSGSGEFTASLNRAQIEPFAFGFKLPDFDLRSQGRFAGDAGKKSGSITATLTSSIGRLDALRPELAGMGTLQISANIDAAYADGKISSKTMSFTLAPAGGQTAVALELLKPITVQLGDKGLQLTPGDDLARLTLTQAPAAWLSAVMPKGFVVAGQGLSGQFGVSAKDDGAIIANTTQSVTFAGLNVKQGDTTLLSGGALELDASAQYLAKGLTAQVRKFHFAASTVASGGVSLKSVAPQNPAVIAQFSGNVVVTPTAAIPQITATGRAALALDVDNLDRTALGKNLPAIAPAGLLMLDSTFDVQCNYPTLQVNTFQTTLTKGRGQTTATFSAITALQKFTVPLRKDVALPVVTGNLATIDLAGVPLEIAQIFLPANLRFSSNPVKGKILLSGAGGNEAGLVVHTTEPLTLDNVQLAQDGTGKFSGVKFSLAPEGSWKSGAIAGNIHLQATSLQGVLVDAMVNADQTQNTLTATVTASGQLGALAAQPLGLEWRNLLADPKPEYALNANFTRTVTPAKTTMTISTAEARVIPAGGVGGALADVKLVQPFTLETDAPTTADAKAKSVWPKLSGDVATVKLTGLPAGVLALALPGYRLQGRNISGDVVVRGAGDGHYALSTNAPIMASGLTVARVAVGVPPTALVNDLTFSIKPSATFSSEGVTAYAIEDLTLSSGTTPLVKGSVQMTSTAGESLPTQAKIAMQADLAELLRQPVLAKYNNLTSGLLKMDGGIEPDGSLRLNAEVAQWAVRDSQTQLPRMVFENATGKLNRATGAVQLTIPVKGEGHEGPTDCTVAFGLDISATPHKFTLNVSGNNLVIDDLLAVKAGLFPPAPKETRPPGAPEPAAAAVSVNSTPDKAPLWGGWLGAAQMQLKTIRFHSFAIDNFQAGAQVSPTQAVIPGVTGSFQNAPISLNGTLAFNAAQADQPYQLQTNLSFQKFDVGAYFKARTPNATPPVEGNFSIAGAVSGKGANINDLIDKVQFNFNLGSDGGTFHLLDLVANKVGVSSTALKAVTSVAGIALSLLGNKKDPTGLTSSTAVSIGELITNLDAIQYTKLVFAAQRGDDLNVKLSQFLLQNPQVELVGTAQVSYVRGVAIPDQPLKATLALNAKSGIAQLLQKAHLIGGATASGYQQGPQFPVAGTLQHPSYGSLYDLLLQAVTGLGAKK